MSLSDKRASNLLAATVLFLLHAFYLRCIAEDAFISFRFAQHLADGHGLIWNIGEGPVEGYTNFLWVVICALLTRLQLDLPVSSQILGLLASTGTLVYTYRCAREVIDGDDTAHFIPCLFLAASGPFATWATSGMETSLFGLFLVMACFYLIRYFATQGRGALAACYGSLLLATLTRPEGFGIFGVLLVLTLWGGPATRRHRVDSIGIPLFVYVIPFAIYFVWRYQYFGYLLPNTFYAKVSATIYTYARGLMYVSSFGLHFLLPLAIIPVVVAWGSSRDEGARSPERVAISKVARDHVGLVVLGAVSLAYLGYIVSVGGDYMAMYRFIVPVLPMLYLLFGAACGALFRVSAGSRRRYGIASGLVVVALAATIVPSTPVESMIFRTPKFHHGLYRGVETERWHVARLRLIGEMFDRYKRGPEDSLATGAIGAVGYYADMRILDFSGLVDPHIAHMEVDEDQKLGWGLPGHEKIDIPYTLSKRPTYVMFNRQLSRGAMQTRDKDTLYRDYDYQSVWLVDYVNGEEGFFTFLELRDR